VAEGEGTTIDGGPSADRAGSPFRSAIDRDRSRPPSLCRFLAVETADGSYQAAGGTIDPDNRCVALGDPVPQSAGQQELVCLTSAHETCPRFLRGVLLAAAPPAAPAREPISRAVLGASLVLAASIAASFGFLAVRGGFDLPAGSSPVLVADVESAAPSLPPAATPTLAPTAMPTPTATPTPTASPSPSTTPEATPTLTPAPTATPTPSPTPAPSSDRYAVLTACPSTPDCWIYVIRAGDNLTSIAHWFGVPYERMIAMNPDLRLPIHAGDKLRIPTPTR